MTNNVNNFYYDSIARKTEKEDIMNVVGKNGRWQIGVSIHIFFIMSVLAMHNLCMSFLAPKQDHWCARPPNAINKSIGEWKSVALPSHDRYCSRYDVTNFTDFEKNNSSHTEVRRCFSWEYDKTFYSSTLVSKWNLVCSRKWLVSLTKSIFMFGILVSNILFGHLSDRFGRKPVIISCSIITSFFASLCAFSTSITLFTIIRFFIGIGLGGFHSTSFVLLMEIVVPEMRPLYGMGVQLGWCLGFVVLPGFAWIIRDSFWLLIALAVLAYIQMAFSWLIPESPRWLISCGKTEKARTVLMQAAKKNQLPTSGLDHILEKAIADNKWESGKKEHKTLLDLLKTPGLRRITVFLFLIWFITSFVYYGLSFNTNELSGNPFINFALSGAMEFPAYFLPIFFLRSIGRKRPLAASLILGGAICLILYLIPIDIPQTIVAAAMIGKFCITVSFGILYVFTAELFPTVARNIGLGSSTVCEGLGSILAPFVRELGHATHPAIPQFVFGILSLAGGALVIFLPETNDLIIPDTLEEAIQITRGKGIHPETTKSAEGQKIQ